MTEDKLPKVNEDGIHIGLVKNVTDEGFTLVMTREQAVSILGEENVLKAEQARAQEEDHEPIVTKTIPFDAVGSYKGSPCIDCGKIIETDRAGHRLVDKGFVWRQEGPLCPECYEKSKLKVNS